MSPYARLTSRASKLALIGLGYVGLPIALAFAQKGVDVVGFDINKAKIDHYISGVDPAHEVDSDDLLHTAIEFTTEESRLKEACFHIIAVPTPAHADHTPDLTPLISASETVGRNLSKGSFVVYESTVYPGCTEEVCIPVLERTSGMKCGVDFKVGYSPERINPGDRVHRLENIPKIVAGMDDEALKEIQRVYGLVVAAGTYAVSNIRTAEAVKVAENSQRDINIAFMNELAMAFDRMDIDTNEVVDGMNTKWNALGFRPGLVGGHCIGVDPYYFAFKAEKLGCHSQTILQGRSVNDHMGEYIADAAVRKMVAAGLAPKYASVVILGLTFKENCSDIRNSKVADLYHRLRDDGISPLVVDPRASAKEAEQQYGIHLTPMEEVHGAECVIVAVAHTEFQAMGLAGVMKLFKPGGGEARVLLDVKGLYPVAELRQAGISWWRL